MYSDEGIVSFWSKIIFEVLFIGFSLWYLFSLNSLNNSLKDHVDINDSFAIVSYNNYQPAKYALLALFVVIVAVVFVIWYFITAKSYMFHPAFLVLSILTTVVNTIIIVFTWNFISNPILRAVIIVIVIGCGGLYALSQN